MKRFLKLYGIEQKLCIRSMDSVIFGVVMPVGILVLISLIAGSKMTGDGGYTFLQSAFGSLCAVGICACAFMGLPLTIADYRDKKILKHFFVTPCSPMTFLGAIMLSNTVITIVSALLVSAVAVIFFHYAMMGNMLIFIGTWILTLVSMFSIGICIASVCGNVKTANVVTSLVYFPMLFLSGATIPFEIFPKGLQTVAQVLPLSQAIRLMKAASCGNSLEYANLIVVELLVITAVCTVISVKTFKWE